MSADSYAICPRCKVLDPFLDTTDEDFRTLREDYEFYLRPDGRFTARYRARCEECDWHFTFDEERQAFTADPSPDTKGAKLK